MFSRLSKNILLFALFAFLTACGSSVEDPSLEFVELTEDGSTVQTVDPGAVDSGAKDGQTSDPGVVSDIVGVDTNTDAGNPPEDNGTKNECELANVPASGLCDGDNLVGCVDGSVFSVDCAQLGLFCGPDADGALSCVPNQCESVCDGKECGGDGCGGSCGDCSDGAECLADGQCSEVCQSECEGKQCGGDGCGGLCGTCGDDASCNGDGQCVENCKKQCDGKQCGPDGCGGFCGECGAGTSCDSSGQCNEDCEAQCDGKQCGPDTCGGICGLCDPGATCNSQGQCEEECEPSCENGKNCGPDGCGGNCGTCDGGFVCNDNGYCKPPPDPCDDCGQDEICENNVCVPDPACGEYTYVGCCIDGATKWCSDGQVKTKNCNNSCGWVNNNNWYDCGGQGPDPTGTFPIECPCEAQCIGKECGGDGCGGSCGTCAPGESCNSGQCISIPPADPCEGIPTTGQCDGDVKLTCNNGVPESEDCGAQDKVCWIQVFPVLEVSCKWPWQANCPDYLFDGYCSGNLLIQCEDDDLWIIDCVEEGKVCGFSGGFGAGCINN